jgi:type I restriction enzyme S subunit
MKDNLKFFKIGEVAEIFAGGDKPDNFNLTKTNEYQVPVFANGENNKGLQGFTDKARVTQPAVTISARGTIGYTVLRDEPFVPIVRLLTLIPDNKKIDLKYIYYYLTIFRQAGLGSSQAQLTVPDISDRKILIPDLSKQKEIGRLLSLLDKKINLNNKINSELEKIAKTLYDYWFVQFDFPDVNGKPYKSSGGKMVWSEDLKKNVPYGWDAKKLEDIFEFKKGVEPGSAEYLNSPINEHCIKFFRVGDIEGESSVYIDSRNKKYSFVHEKDVVVTFDGSVGKVGIGLNGAISGGLRKVYDKYGKLDNSLVYFIFKDKRIIATIHKYAIGSILLHASSSINHLKIAYKEKIYLQFQEKIQPIYDQIIKNKKENQKLAELRDFLLPMLMNGQVSIK